MSNKVEVGDLLVIKKCKTDYFFSPGARCVVFKIDNDGDVWGDFNDQGNPVDSFKGHGRWCLGRGDSMNGLNQNSIFEKQSTSNEAAKIKPKEPEYEWQWLIYDDRDGTYETTIHCKTQEQAEHEICGYKLFKRIEESKREVCDER